MMHDIAARGIEQHRQIGGGARDSARNPARRHGADKHARVGMMLLHADTVAQNRAAGDRAGRIDRNYAHCLAFGAQQRNHAIAQCALARARRSGDA